MLVTQLVTVLNQLVKKLVKYLVVSVVVRRRRKRKRNNMKEKPSTGFQKLLLSMMDRRWLMTLIVLITFMLVTFGILLSIHSNTEVSGEWKELLLLLLGAFIGSYGKIIDYWFSDTDKDKMLVQKMDEEDGESLSNTN
jgi:TRAP-type C4-dicarboxylate transport system permease large subunit